MNDLGGRFVLFFRLLCRASSTRPRTALKHGSGKRLMRCILYSASVVAVAGAMPAAAKNNPAVPQLEESLRFEVVGEVPVDCSLTQPVAAVTIDDAADPETNVARAARASLPFSVSCNTPISVSLVSRNGGLSFDGSGSADTDFTTQIGYSARLDLPGHANALSCVSAEMTAEGTGCSGSFDDALIEGDGAVELTLQPGRGLLLQGNYADLLTVTVTPVTGGET